MAQGKAKTKAPTTTEIPKRAKTAPKKRGRKPAPQPLCPDCKNIKASEAKSALACENPFHNGVMGRPTLYDPDFCRQIVEYFHIDATKTIQKTITTKGGSVIEEEAEAPAQMRFLVDFCMEIGVSSQTLHNWCKKYPDFLVAYTRARELQERHLVLNALHGGYNDRFAGLVAKNWFGYTEKEQVDHTTKGESLNNQRLAPDKAKKLTSILETHFAKRNATNGD